MDWKKVAIWSIGGFLFLCVSCGIFGALVPDADDGETVAEVDATATPEATEVPTEEPTVSEPTTDPVQIVEPEERVRIAITDALGRGNREIDRVGEISFTMDEPPQIYVLWTINSNITEEFTVQGAKIDVRNMLEAIDFTEFNYSSVLVEGTYSMIDQFGNTSEDKVVRALYHRETVDRINWENFLNDNVYTIADDTTIQVLFQE